MAVRKIALIGLGMAAGPHVLALRDLKSRVEIAAAFSPTEARRTAFSQQYGIATTGDLDAILADPSIAALFILTPPNSHLELVARAAEAGKHILLEKPLDVTPARSRAIVETATAKGVKLGVVLQNRFRPAALQLAELLAAGRLGKLVDISVSIRNWRPQSYYDQAGRGTLARDGGGVLLTQGIHAIDLLIALGGLPDAVFARAVTSPVHRMETEDMVSATLIYDDGAMGSLTATTAAFPGYPERIEIIGSRGTAVFEGDRLAVRLADGGEIDGGASLGSGAGADPMAFDHAMHRALIEDFLDAIDLDRTPRITGEDALAAHRLIEALLASAASGKVERLGA